jgi:predicted short-subunit dehydrogenase-like oxidoreductase (DUF2520 family)
MLEKVAIIGIGRLGSALALKLKSAGYEIAYLVDKEIEKAVKIAFATEGKAIISGLERLQETDILFLTLPDDEIEYMAKELSKLPFDWWDKIVIHCSGVNTVEILRWLEKKGARTLSIHPYQTFPQEADTDRFYEIFCSVEGEDYEAGARIVKALRAFPFKIDSQYKVLSHISACIASNYVYSLLATAEQIMVQSGMEAEIARRALLPLVRGTVESYEQLATPNGLSGPIARGDINTVKKHLLALRENKLLKEIYQKLGIGTLNLTGLSKTMKDRMFRELRK